MILSRCTESNNIFGRPPACPTLSYTFKVSFTVLFSVFLPLVLYSTDFCSYPDHWLHQHNNLGITVPEHHTAITSGFVPVITWHQHDTHTCSAPARHPCPSLINVHHTLMSIINQSLIQGAFPGPSKRQLSILNDGPVDCSMQNGNVQKAILMKGSEIAV